MGRRKFQEDDLCTLNRSKANDSLLNRHDEDVIFRVSGYDRGRYTNSTNKYVVHPVGKQDQEDKIRPSYRNEYEGTVHGKGLSSQFDAVKDRIDTLKGKKQEAERERERIQEKIEFKNEWNLDEFDEDLWNAANIHDIIDNDNRGREEKIRSIAHLLKAC